MRNALESILASEPFRDSPQLKAFLGFIVSETLAGRGGDLKGYSIATMALGRPESFDPQIDPIVRVQAGRLRQALAEYYAANPATDVVIALEKGKYAPTFAYAARGPAMPAASSEPAEPAAGAGLSIGRRGLLLGGAAALAASVAAGGAWFSLRPQTVMAPAPPSPPPSPEQFFPTLVVEVDIASTQPGITMIASRVRDAISRFDDLVVVGESDDMVPAAPRSGREPGWNLSLRMKGEHVGDGNARLSARLLSQPDQRVIWSREFDPIPVGPAGDRAASAVVRVIASSLAQPYGVIHAHIRGLLDQRRRADDPYRCVVDGLDYWLFNSRQTHLEARTCIIERLKSYPTFGPLHAQLTYLHLEEFRQGYNPLPGDPQARALESARNAVRHRPTSARSHQSLMAAKFASGDLDGAWRAGADALALNPNDTEIIADIGSYRIMAGEFEMGLAYLDQAIDLNPAPPAWVITFRALALYMLGRLELSGPMAKTLEGSEYPPAQMALIMAAYQFRNGEAGKRHLAEFRQKHPEIASNPLELLHRMNFQREIAAKVMTDFNAAVEWIGRQ